MNLKIPIFAFILFVSNSGANAQTIASLPAGNVGNLGSGSVLHTSQSWGYAYLTIAGMLLTSLFLSFLLVGFIARRRIEEAKMRRTLLLILALGMGILFGSTFVFLVPKAFGAQIQNYTTSSGSEVDVYLLTDSYLSSLFLLIGFTFFLLVDLIARHFIAKTHMSTTRVPGISHSPVESMRIEESSRPPVLSVLPGGNVPPGTVPAGGMGPIGMISTDPNLVRAERVSTEPRSDADLGFWRRRRLGLEGSKKQSILILLREFVFSGFIGMTVGAVFGLYTRYNILAISLGLYLAHFLITTVDSALLYYVGVSYKRVLLYNFLWNFIMFGTVAWGRGMAARGLLGAAYIFAAMSGIFIYLILVHLMPALVKGKKYDLKAVYLLDFLVGTYVVFALRTIED